MADGKVVINSKIDDSGITRGLRAIQTKLSGLNANLLKTSAIGSAVSLAPSLVPMIASATAATLALSSSFAAAGVGAVAFGAVTVGVLGQVFEAADQVAQLEEKIANADTAKERIAAQKELAALYADMSKAQKNALQDLQSFKSFWSDFIKQFEDPIFEAFSSSLSFTKNLLQGLAPTISNVADVINQLLNEMNGFGEDGGFQSFFEWLATNAAGALYNFAHITGNVLGGFFSLMQAFAPLGVSMEEGLFNLTERFKEWAAALSGSEAFQAFVDYAMRNGPVVMSVLGNLVTAIIELGTALSPVGEIALDVLDILTSFLAGDLLGAAASFERAFGQEALTAVLGFFESIKTGIEQAIPLLESIKEFLIIFAEAAVERFLMVKDFAISAFSLIWSYLQPLVIEMVAFFQEKLQQLTQFWQENGGQIMQATQNAFDFVLSIIEFIMPAVMFIIESVWTSIKGVIDGALNIIMGLLKIFAGIFTGDMEKMWEGVKQLFFGALEFLWNLFSLMMIGKLITGIKSFAMSGLGLFKSFGSAVKGTFTDFIHNIVNLFGYFKATGSSIWRATVDTVKNIVKTFVNTVKTNFDDLLNSAKSKFNAVKDAIMNPVKTAKDAVKGFIDEIKGFFKNLKLKIPKPDLPKLPKFDLTMGSKTILGKTVSYPTGFDVDWFKEGGVFPANSPRLVGIGDASVPEAAIPLKPSVLGMIGQKIVDTMAMPGNPTTVGKYPAEFRFVLGGQEFSAFVDDITKAQQRKSFRLRKK